jgi:hypothetical protein
MFLTIYKGKLIISVKNIDTQIYKVYEIVVRLSVKKKNLFDQRDG